MNNRSIKFQGRIAVCDKGETDDFQRFLIGGIVVNPKGYERLTDSKGWEGMQCVITITPLVNMGELKGRDGSRLDQAVLFLSDDNAWE